MTALVVGDLVTVRHLSPRTVALQRSQQRLHQCLVGPDVLIRQPFNYEGVPMTIARLDEHGEAECHVHDLRVQLNVMGGRARAMIPRKYLIRYKKKEST